MELADFFTAVCHTAFAFASASCQVLGFMYVSLVRDMHLMMMNNDTLLGETPHTS
jgi:hypothetical protein